MPKIVIEVRGGVVVEAYSDDPVEVILVDWDDAAAGPRDRAARRFPCTTLKQLPNDTAELISIAANA